ncbi:phosphatase PAP2 family protein [Succinivibrio sp.]|uniref:acid phosphatase n=1 Tax=Succinivibrio sp. TaxID=2053619 RepID=UPI0025FBD668|nr:phosphatase PAP2 family protein [Succinivibrio sp.]MBQ9221512.1 phosphatase PAP2 family protein [Succinivibrio sp.]
MILSWLKFLKKISLTVVMVLLFSGCTVNKTKLPPDLDSLKSSETGRLPEFDSKDGYPDFVALVQSYPQEKSYVFANDKMIFKETRKLKDTQIWNDAARFAEINPEILSAYFSPVMSKPITKENTPWTYYLVARLIADVASFGTRGLKNYYKRVRPYVYFNTETCSTKNDEEDHRQTYSYPSTHSTYGQALALVLSEIDPASQAGIIKKGADYGFFRVVCGFHWNSDVELGRIVASYVVARLHSNAEFSEALKYAKEEYRSLQK